MGESDYKFANLKPKLVERIKQFETELSSELHEPVVLLAYEKQEPAEAHQ